MEWWGVGREGLVLLAVCAALCRVGLVGIAGEGRRRGDLAGAVHDDPVSPGTWARTGVFSPPFGHGTGKSHEPADSKVCPTSNRTRHVPEIVRLFPLVPTIYHLVPQFHKFLFLGVARLSNAEWGVQNPESTSSPACAEGLLRRGKLRRLRPRRRARAGRGGEGRKQHLVTLCNTL